MSGLVPTYIAPREESSGAFSGTYDQSQDVPPGRVSEIKSDSVSRSAPRSGFGYSRPVLVDPTGDLLAVEADEPPDANGRQSALPCHHDDDFPPHPQHPRDLLRREERLVRRLHVLPPTIQQFTCRRHRTTPRSFAPPPKREGKRCNHIRRCRDAFLQGSPVRSRRSGGSQQAGMGDSEFFWDGFLNRPPARGVCAYPPIPRHALVPVPACSRAGDVLCRRCPPPADRFSPRPGQDAIVAGVGVSIHARS